MKIALFIVISYFMGSIPTGVWLGKYFKKVDIRKYGSKNSGATNVYRVLGAKYGIMVLIGDMLKGIIPIYLANKSNIDNINILAFIGMIAILAHTYSIFINFKGGKGVATSLGVFLYLTPKVIMILLIIFLLVFFISRYVSLSSIISAIFLPILMIYFYNSITLDIISIIIGIFIVVRHKTNIKRLLNGKETKFTFKR